MKPIPLKGSLFGLLDRVPLAPADAVVVRRIIFPRLLAQQTRYVDIRYRTAIILVLQVLCGRFTRMIDSAEIPIVRQYAAF